MRSFLRPQNRRTRARERFTSRFKSDSANRPGSRDLVRFRRNRELLAREILGVLLWSALSIMLLMLGRTLWRVAQVHLVDRSVLLQIALPGLAVAGMILCIVRARNSWREWLDIRREQRELLAKLRSDAGLDDPPASEA